MQIYKDLSQIEPNFNKGSVVTLGNFDGVHLAHRALVQQLKQASFRLNLPAVVVTYYPNPSVVLGKNKDFKYIYTEEKKISCLREMGVHSLIVVPFTLELSEKSAYHYIREILSGILHARYILLGYNHYFGKNREGDYDFLLGHKDEFSFEVEKLEPVYIGNEKISSSYLRSLLLKGEIETCNQMLCKPFSIDGTVAHGDKRGRTIGFPTANLEVQEDRLIPGNGVYSGILIYKDKKYKSMMNIGFRPTFNGEKRSIEIHILDFEGDIYGEKIEFIFFNKIREEQKFSGIAELKDRLNLDKEITGKLVNL